MATPVQKRVQLVVALAMVAMVGLAARHFLRSNAKQSAATSVPERANPVAQLPITSVAEIVNATDRNTLVGSRIQFVGVRVQQVDGGGAFWIGRFGETLLIVAAPGTKLAVGERVNISGSVQPVYNLDPAWLDKNLGVADTDTAQHFGVYIQADSVTPG